MSNKDFQNGFALGLSSGGVVEVVDTTEIDNLEDLIDDSGVLEDTEGSVTEKVGELIDKVAYELKSFECITNASTLFQDAKSFPSKAVVNLPNATTLYQAFSYWDKTPIPIVEEVIVNAPKVNRIDQMFHENHGVKKVILNASDNVNNMSSIFTQNKRLEEVVLNFSTQNVGNYQRAFWGMFNTIKRIIGVLDFSSATNVSEMFYCCSHLEEVTFEPNTLSISISLAQSSKLTAESVQSIIDGLKIVETAQTLNLNKAIVLTDEQKATINAKGWTLAQ